MESKFGLPDYVVFGLVLAISAAIGLYYRLTGGKQRTVDEYLMANKNMSIVPVGFSLMASFMSAVTLLGVPSENYTYGTQFVIINISYIFGTFVAAFLYLPVFFNLQATSVYEYLQIRFGKPTRLAASFAFIVQMVLYMAIVLYAPALALNAVTGFSKWASILSVGFVCTFYSTIGGMKAVLWTDVFQSLLMFAAIFAVIIRGLQDNSFSKIWEIAENGKRIEFFNFNPDPTVRHTFWTQMIGGIFTYTSLYGVNQAQVQRLLTVKNIKKSQMALFLNWPILTLLSLTSSFSGIVVYSKYYNCDPIKSTRISSSDQILPLFVMDFLSHVPGLAGLFVSGIFSGALSTISSAVTSLAAVTVEDFVKPCIPARYKHDRSLTIITKGLAFGFGLMCIALTYMVEQFGSILQASLTIFGIVGGALLGLFSLGMFCSCCNQKGALMGYFCGLVISCWFGFGAMITRPYNPILPQSISECPKNVASEGNNSIYMNSLAMTTIISEFDATVVTEFKNASNNSLKLDTFYDKNSDILYPYRISYMWLAPIGFFTVLIVGVVTSILTGGNTEMNTDLLSPPFAYCYRHQMQLSMNKRFSTLDAVAEKENGVEPKKSILLSEENSHEICITRL